MECLQLSFSALASPVRFAAKDDDSTQPRTKRRKKKKKRMTTEGRAEATANALASTLSRAHKVEDSQLAKLTASGDTYLTRVG